MTDHLPSSQAHPTPDELAELRADALDATRAAEVSAHVLDCARCSGEVAAIDSVQELLAEAGREPVAIPDDVAAALDSTLARAQAERSGGVPSLADRREARDPATDAQAARGRDRSRWLGGLGVAAAVLAFVVGGGMLLENTDQGADDSADSSAAAESAPDDAGSSGGQGSDDLGTASGKAPQLAPQPISEGDLASFARSLVRHSGANRVAQAQADAELRGFARQYRVSRCPEPVLTGPDLRIPVRFEQQLAYAEVNRETREAVVYTCDSPPERLSSTTY